MSILSAILSLPRSAVNALKKNLASVKAALDGDGHDPANAVRLRAEPDAKEEGRVSGRRFARVGTLCAWAWSERRGAWYRVFIRRLSVPFLPNKRGYRYERNKLVKRELSLAKRNRKDRIDAERIAREQAVA